VRVPFEPPEGFRVERADGAVLYAAEGWAGPLLAAGLGRPERWRDLLEADSAYSGRGPVRRLELEDGRTVLLKRMLRGGLLGPLWAGRYPRAARLRNILVVSWEAPRRGVPAARAVALLLREGPRPLFRAWLATEEIAGAEDLRAWLAEGRAPGEFGQLLDKIRRAHDAGLRHADLNLGNVLVRTGGPDGLEVFFVDLDRARLEGRPVSRRERLREIRRLARSFRKRFGDEFPAGVPAPSEWTRLYVEGVASSEESAKERNGSDGEAGSEQPPGKGAGLRPRERVLPSPAKGNDDDQGSEARHRPVGAPEREGATHP
jgi:3-deoxy-D-manno-octulosonic acid kinase